MKPSLAPGRDMPHADTGYASPLEQVVHCCGSLRLGYGPLNGRLPGRPALSLGLLNELVATTPPGSELAILDELLVAGPLGFLEDPVLEPVELDALEVVYLARLHPSNLLLVLSGTLVHAFVRAPN